MQLAPRAGAGALLERPRDAVGHQEPAWHVVAVPGVDQCLDWLLEEIALDMPDPDHRCRGVRHELSFRLRE